MVWAFILWTLPRSYSSLLWNPSLSLWSNFFFSVCGSIHVFRQKNTIVVSSVSWVLRFPLGNGPSDTLEDQTGNPEFSTLLDIH